ncbi:synaptotagmin-like protein 2 isoform X3 [Brachyhypopomus gauderio]|uniref:synaptotagmin-like protein 2 isoform X3 n=1 Tax=Brachyhypopomus gauderio TaxID=698409 RepID=UPI00404375F7
MIDLSYLTEEEQGAIEAVLQRDARLKTVDEQRVQKLRKTERRGAELKCLTGEWFYETKSHRHGDWRHGSDIIRASMRDHRAVTILELSQIWPEKPRFLTREIKDVFIPPELCGLIEVPSHPQCVSREEETEKDDFKAAAPAHVKPRQNPFNNPFKILELESPKKADGQLPSRARAAHPVPVDTHHVPTDSHHIPTDTHHVSTDTPHVPTDLRHVPTDTHHVPTDSHQTPADTHQPSADRHQASADTHQASVDTHHIPTDTHQARVDTRGGPAPRHLSTVETLEPDAPVDSQLTPGTGGCKDPSHVTALKQTNVRPVSISKSLEDMATLSLHVGQMNDAQNDVTLSMEDVSGQMKMLSASVPDFTQQQSIGTQGGPASVDTHYSDRLRKDSMNTDHSSSSSLATMSSVSGSVTSISRWDFGNVEVKGTIQFAMNYVEKLGEFHIFIVQCRDLAVAEPKRNRSDPYVKCYLLPDKATLGKRKTSVKKKTQNPTYNEILRQFKIPVDSLTKHTLNVSVWHNDTFGRNCFLGEVNKDLSEWDFDNTHIMDCVLKGRIPVQSSPKCVNVEMNGEIRVALRFILPTSIVGKKSPQTGEVQIWVKECKSLPSRGGNTFVKCTVLPDTGRKGLHKTPVVKKTANPVFNHTMVYDDFKPEDLREVCVELTVWDRDRLSNHFIGGTRLGLGTGTSYGADVNWMDSSPAEAGLWKRMTESQNEWVEDVVPLRLLIMAGTMARK